eukprot:4665557-Prorocentrum_lima.AAC.1
MQLEPRSCTPKSQDASASSFQPARQDYREWNAAMPREFKQLISTWSHGVVLESEETVTHTEKPWVIAESQDLKRAMLIKWHTGRKD